MMLDPTNSPPPEVDAPASTRPFLLGLLNGQSDRGERDESEWQAPGRLPPASGSLNALDLTTYASANAVVSEALRLPRWPISLAALLVNGVYVHPDDADAALDRLRGFRQALAAEVPEVGQIMSTLEGLVQHISLSSGHRHYVTPDEVLRFVALGGCPDPQVLPGLAARAHAALFNDHRKLLKTCAKLEKRVAELQQEGSGSSPRKVNALEDLLYILVQRDGRPREFPDVVARAESEITKASGTLGLTVYKAPTRETLRTYLDRAGRRLGLHSEVVIGTK